MPGDRHPYRDTWTLPGAHLLLQTRTKVLNDEFENVFRRWYPQFRLKLRDPRVAAALLVIEEIGRITGEFARARRPEIRFEKTAAQQFP